MISPRLCVLLALLVWLLPQSWAGPAAKRLTLDEALMAAESAHPDIRVAEADQNAALADLEAATSRSDLAINAEAGLRQAYPSSGMNTRIPDNSIKLNARKNLYDFGRSAGSEQAARAVVEARDIRLLETREQRRLDVRARFFAVLAADMQFTADNEYMAVAYVTADNAKDHFKLGQISAAELAEVESRYQDILVRRNASQDRARLARVQLANAMNQQGNLAAELEDPSLAGNNRTLPDYESLLPIMQQNNPRLRVSLALLDASRQRMEALRAENSPVLDAEVEAAGYSRESTTRDNLRAGVVLTWPLYQGRRMSAQLAREQAQFYKIQAETDRLRMDLTETLLEVWAEAGQLQRSVRAAAKKQVEYRDLALEKARGLYEVELKANIGDAMAATMEARLRERTTEYRLALAFARLEALLGKPLENVGKEGQVK